jgi:hypothetical protein
MDDALLHHEQEIFLGVGEESDAIEGIAIDNEEIGNRTGNKGA